ncbi:hypothetical protein, partial [Niallia oryzisoli]|uniref:hypothetical protein n=1 Tax=Niallia oryzisoli TaxID=1737571 RepID=UPI0037362F5C
MGKKRKVKVKNKFHPNFMPHIEVKPTIQLNGGSNNSLTNVTGACECSGSTKAGIIRANISPNNSTSNSQITVKTKHQFTPTSFNPPVSYSTPEGIYLLSSGTGMATNPKTGEHTTGIFTLLLQQNQIGRHHSARFMYSGINPKNGKLLTISKIKQLANQDLTISLCANCTGGTSPNLIQQPQQPQQAVNPANQVLPISNNVESITIILENIKSLSINHTNDFSTDQKAESSHTSDNAAKPVNNAVEGPSIVEMTKDLTDDHLVEGSAASEPSRDLDVTDQVETNNENIPNNTDVDLPDDETALEVADSDNTEVDLPADETALELADSDNTEVDLPADETALELADSDNT